MKLHELLAVESNLETQANKVRTELSATFEKKRHLFEEKRTTFKSNQEGVSPVVESQSDLQSTVADELKWISAHLARYIDAAYQVAEGNTAARADVILEGAATPLLKNLPATALLELEKRVGEIRGLFLAIPTLDPAKGFKPDDSKRDGAYRARDVHKSRTTKVQEPIVVVQATKEFPAQVVMVNKDIATGTIEEIEWSGLITPAQKSDLIDRVEILARAVRAARSRANDAEIKRNETIAGVLFKYLLDE